METTIRDLVKSELSDVHTAIPGIIQSVNFTKMTVTVKPAINIHVMGKSTEPTELVEVPFSVPSSGGFSVTLPIKKGDECLVVFSERTIDSWAVTGGKHQTEVRNHHLNDGLAILGFKSQPKAIPAYNTKYMEIRDEKAHTRITIKPPNIEISTPDKVEIYKADLIIKDGDIIVEKGNICALAGEVGASGVKLTQHTHNQLPDSDGDVQMPTAKPNIV
jgi:hypothetical protein